MKLQGRERWRWQNKHNLRSYHTYHYNMKGSITMNLKHTLKRTFAAVGTAALLFGMTACGGDVQTSASSTQAAAQDAPKVGLIQLMEHPSLDEIRTAIEAELDAKLGENAYQYDYQNAQGDTSTIANICQKFVADDVDVIIAIATNAAQGAAAAVKGTDIPVVFSAVTDPQAAGLVSDPEKPDANITGTSDAIPVEKIFDLAGELTPDVKSYGLIYNNAEPNSVSVIEQTKAYLDSKGISYVESAVTATGEVQTAAQSLLGQCDAVFAPIDNTVASAMPVLAREAINVKKPVYVAADSMVADGGLATVGVNYTQLGTQTADMAAKVLQGTPVSELPVEILTENAVVVNEETAKAIGVDVSAYVK